MYGCNHNYLFFEKDWFTVERQFQSAVNQEINGMDNNRILNTSPDSLCDYFEKKYRIDVPVLLEDQIVADPRDVTINIGHKGHYNIFSDFAGMTQRLGTAIDVIIPFSGDANAFTIKPSISSSNLPRATVKDALLTITIEGADLDAGNVKNEIDHNLNSIKQHLNWLRQNVDGWNNQIKNIARQAIERRRQKLLSDQNLAVAIGFPLKKRADAIATYTAPEVRRKIIPVLPPASTAPYKPEPTLAVQDYEHILNVIKNMALVMELSPSAFVGMDEESLRGHFLVQLNGHYEGQATGETFNYEGKTDILIRSSGQNIFIAECKFWNGSQKLTETVDQILGYASWRDTKVAIIIFNRNKNFTQVLNAIPQAVQAHANCKSNLGNMDETSSRYILTHKDDPNRELTLTITAFDIPTTSCTQKNEKLVNA